MIVKDVGPDFMSVGLGIETVPVLGDVARPPYKKQYAYEVTNLDDERANKRLNQRRPHRARQPVHRDGEGRESQQHAT